MTFFAAWLSFFKDLFRVNKKTSRKYYWIVELTTIFVLCVVFIVMVAKPLLAVSQILSQNQSGLVRFQLMLEQNPINLFNDEITKRFADMQNFVEAFKQLQMALSINLLLWATKGLLFISLRIRRYRDAGFTLKGAGFLILLGIIVQFLQLPILGLIFNIVLFLYLPLQRTNRFKGKLQESGFKTFFENND